MGLRLIGTIRGRVLPAMLFLSAFAFQAYGEKLNPVQWTLKPASIAPGKAAVLTLHAEIEQGYHLYSLTTPKGGPIQTTVVLSPNLTITSNGIYQPAPNRQMDPTLGAVVEVFTGPVNFLLPVQVNKVSAQTVTVTAKIRYQACSDRICLPPVNREATASIIIEPGAPAPSLKVPAGYRKVSTRVSGYSRESADR